MTRAAYGEEHATAMRMAANLAAVAIENVRLLERESTARAAAEESNRLKDEFLATVSHELRTPLTAILGWSRMLEGGLDAEMAARAIETIKRNAKAQAQIIDDILDVSRIITGNLYLELHPIELAPVLESAVNVVRPTAEAKGIQIEFDFAREPAVVSGDANRLQQVFWNLLSNAVKFTAPGGKVTLALRQLDSEVEIEITDTGQGIEPGIFAFRFRSVSPGRQHLNAAARRIGFGAGHRAPTGRDSRRTYQRCQRWRTARERLSACGLPLIGSLATVDQCSRTALNQKAEPTQAQDVLAGIEVLVVDDDMDTLELLSAALKQRSANVTAVSSTAAAMDVDNGFQAACVDFRYRDARRRWL